MVKHVVSKIIRARIVESVNNVEVGVDKAHEAGMMCSNKNTHSSLNPRWKLSDVHSKLSCFFLIVFRISDSPC